MAEVQLSSRAKKAISFRVRGHSRKDSLRLAGYGEAQYAHCAGVFWERKLVIKELERRQKDVARKADVEAGDLVKLLMEIAGFDPASCVDEDTGQTLPMHLIPAQVRKTLNFATYGKGHKINNA
ncbi:unnamed protein product, partial [marine sediment metagenome]